MLELTDADFARWRSRVLVTATCWLWMGAVGLDGYGKLGIRQDGRQRTITPHQVAAVDAWGAMPAGSTVLHDCDVRLCVSTRPGHVRVSTHGENVPYAAALDHVRRPRFELWARGTTPVNVNWIPAGQRAIISPLLFSPPIEPASVTVTVIVGEFRTAAALADCKGYRSSSGLHVPVSGVSIDRSSSYFQKITGQVTNLTAEVVKSASVNCVLRAGGLIVSGERTGIYDPIVPGGSIAFTVRSFSFIPDTADSVECQVSA